MQITSVTARAVLVPMVPPVISKSGRFDAMPYVLVDVHTDSGLRGIAYLWTFSSHGSRAVLAAMRELDAMARGMNPLEPGEIWKKSWKKLAQWGHGGIAVLAIAGLDIACWDILGKHQRQSVGEMLGGKATAIEAYHSGGLWMIEDLKKLEAEARDIRRAGFKRAKMRVGRETLSEDFAAIEAVYRGMGEDAELMVDANSSWTREHAARWAKEAERYGLLWIEDPLDQDDLEGHAALNASSSTPVCFGEKAFGPHEHRRILDMKANTFHMPDLQRVGGVTPWVEVHDHAARLGTPICSHMFPEFSVQVMSAAPTGKYLEYMDWCHGLFNEQPVVKDGRVEVSARPGFGLSWNEELVGKLADPSA